MNHKSATSMGNALLGSIRAGQDNETYMVVDEDAAKHWLDLQLSTFGCVPMPGVDPHLGARFDESEREMIREKQFSINVHEQLSEVFALFYNKSAVSWCNSLSSREPLAQEQNRVLGALEARLGLRVSAEHLPGASNYLADLGSQGWSGKHATTWQQLTNLWSQVPVSPAARKIYSST
ncbi:hypothetical protein L917_04897 [Phytophthora nicotianae]|uniref:Uncharacterized protein n=1 Tax=Phytophthora nicotianae TaxID=4792 RepID=W2LKB7_PHYNI|nr:hypothetical protein L917_04897 [Phytophthora nicotianae]